MPEQPAQSPMDWQRDPDNPRLDSRDGHSFAFGWRKEHILDDLERFWFLMRRSSLMWRGFNSEYLCGKRGPFYTVAVNGDPTTFDPLFRNAADIDHPHFNDNDPSPPPGGMPVLWQVSATNPSNVSAYVANTVENFTVTGKLTVGGLIDPTGMVFTEQETSPWAFAAGYGALYVKNLAPSLLVYVDDTGVETPISREGTSSGGAATLDSASGTYLATGAVTVNLPATALLGLKKTIKNTNTVASGNNVTVGRNGHNIDGSAANDTLTPLQSATYIGDGMDWWKI